MAATSLIKFANRRLQDGSGARLYWDRVDQDGAPFRGAELPILREEEYDERVVRVSDFKNGYFDTNDPVQNTEFCMIMEAHANGLFQLIHVARFINGTSKHYLEWLEYYMENGTKTPLVPQYGARSNGNGNGASHS